MNLAPGRRLGPYEIVDAIGAGGMGEVYLATDSRLKRDVAIKILPVDFADDPERLARFQREAELLASLNHPNIAQVYGVEERALVMEFVAGEDLAKRIARGPVPIDEALTIAKQIAEALEAAHEQGIVHRDLKPANIKVKDDGTVKVLDFGLAKAVDTVGGPGALRSGATLANSPTITSPAMTIRGVVLGTAPYMSPEQAKGRPVDKRTDIWAYGCVLYEMLTGRRAFDGEDATDAIAAVVTREPDWSLLPAATPPPIHRLLHRCLSKDRSRLQSAGDARLDIDDAINTPIRGATAVQARRPLLHLVVVAVVAVALRREPHINQKPGGGTNPPMTLAIRAAMSIGVRSSR